MERAMRKPIKAKPRKGPIDYAALRKSVRVRFKKLLEQLAK
jgi:hypothetical protein